jgi:hypothetical protein
MDPWLQAVEQIGLIIYAALDFGLREDEERQLSPQLEKLLDLMTSAGNRGPFLTSPLALRGEHNPKG